MGNCCCGGEEKGAPNAFSGQGHRLGSADEVPLTSAPATTPINRDDLPAPIVNDNLTPEEREQQRRDRAAAAEKRAKQMGGTTKPKKKDTSGEPLRGPNTQNTMRWTAG